MGNIWVKKTTNPVELETDEGGPARSIEMKGSNPAKVSSPSSSLSSWPLCLDDRGRTSTQNSDAQKSFNRGRQQIHSIGENAAGPSHSKLMSANISEVDGHLICCLDSDRTSGAAPSNEEDCHEIQLTLKIPCHFAGNGQQELSYKTRQAAERALELKSQECESLVAVVRELTASRNKLTSMKSVQGERFADLQNDFLRVSRVADLSRALSRENIAKATQLSQSLNQVEEELARQRATNQQLKEQCLRLKLENTALKEKMSLINRMDVVAFRRESACLVELQQLHLKETY